MVNAEINKKLSPRAPSHKTYKASRRARDITDKVGLVDGYIPAEPLIEGLTTMRLSERQNGGSLAFKQPAENLSMRNSDEENRLMKLGGMIDAV